MKTLLALCALSAFLPFIARPQEPGPEDPPVVARPGTLPIDEIRAMLAKRAAHEPFDPEAPLGLGDLADLVPAENPLTPAKVELGRQLYFDGRLSRDGTVSCATCHDPARDWTDGLSVSVGIDGQTGGRSAPTIVNRILGGTQFWDGRADDLEAQALGPIGNPIEMGFSPEEAAARLNEICGYALQFEAVFGGPATPDRIAMAIASFERTVLTGGSKLDYYERAYPFFDWEPDEDEDPEFLAEVDRILDLEKEYRLSEAQERGRELFFGKAKCSVCHVGRNLTDEGFHNIGVGVSGDEIDLGRFEVSGREQDKGAFKTPTLRGVTGTGPYMHDGSLETLMDVIEHYDRGGVGNPWLSDKIVPLGLTDGEKRDLLRFTCALNGPTTRVEVPRLP